MKRIYIFLFLILLTSKWIYSCFWQLNFYVNQQEIIRLECENKNRPELNCNGKCYLAKQLKKADEHLDLKKSQHENCVKVFKSLEVSVYIPTAYLDIDCTFYSDLVKNPLYYSDNLSFKHIPSIFHPPC